MSDEYLANMSLGCLLARRDERGQTDDQLLTVSQERGVIPQEDAGRRNISSADKSTYRRVYPGDIVYNTMRMWQGASARSSYFGIVSPAYTVCESRNGVSTQYLAYLLKHPTSIRFFESRSQGITSDVWNLRYAEFAKIRLDIVSQEIHRQRIAEILSTVDETIVHTEAVIAKYQQIKAGLMHDLFTRGVTPDGKLRPIRAEAPDLYKQSPVGWIPKEWDVPPASQMCLLITKGTTPAEFLEQEEESSIPYIRVQNLSFDGSLAFTEDQAFIPSAVSCGELARSRVLPSDILMNIVGPPLGKVSVVLDEYPEWNVNQAIAIFRTKSRESLQYLALYLLSNLAQSWFLARAKRTSGQVNLTLQMCRELPVPIPSEPQERDTITGRLVTAENQIRSEVLSLNKLRQQKHGLMHDLLTGHTRVKTDELKNNSQDV